MYDNVCELCRFISRQRLIGLNAKDLHCRPKTIKTMNGTVAYFETSVILKNSPQQIQFYSRLINIFQKLQCTAVTGNQQLKR